MLELNIPGYKVFSLSYLLLDFNGTLATSGILIKGVRPRLMTLSKQLELHVITGDSFSTACEELSGINCEITILPAEEQMNAKLDYCQRFKPENTIAIGNGRNDQQMLKYAEIGIAIAGSEGAATEAIQAAKIVTPSILVALDLLIIPRRLVATLRS